MSSLPQMWSASVMPRVETSASDPAVKRAALFARGAAIHDQHRNSRVDGAMDIAQRVLGANHAHYAKAGERDAIPRPMVDLPTEHGFLAVDLHFAVGEARPRVNIGRARFHVVAGQAAGGKAGGKRNGGGRAKHGGGA